MCMLSEDIKHALSAMITSVFTGGGCRCVCCLKTLNMH